MFGVYITVKPVYTKAVTFISKGKSETIKFPKVTNKKADWWKSSDEKIATADTEKKSGKVKAVSFGSCDVSCSYNGFTFLTKVYVEEPQMKYNGTNITSSDNKKTTAVGQTSRIEMDKVYQTVNYKSSKPAVAFVDENGFIYARNAGKTNITTKLNGRTYKLVLTVE